LVSLGVVVVPAASSVPTTPTGTTNGEGPKDPVSPRGPTHRDFLTILPELYFLISSSLSNPKEFPNSLPFMARRIVLKNRS
jgi:hypothetical protein